MAPVKEPTGRIAVATDSVTLRHMAKDFTLAVMVGVGIVLVWAAVFFAFPS
jgi:hypothetical protein